MRVSRTPFRQARTPARKVSPSWWLAFVGVIVGSALLLELLSLPWAGAATQAFVQARSKQITTGTVNSLAFTSANTAGNLIVVYVVWDNSGPVTLRDSRGNPYTSVRRAHRVGSGGRVALADVLREEHRWRDEHRHGHVRAPITSFGRIYIHEYSGLDRTAPLDVSRRRRRTAAAMNSGSATTTNANDVIFGAGSSNNNVTAAGTGFTSRLNANRSRTEDKTVTTAGLEQRDSDAERRAVGHAHGRLQGRCHRPQRPDAADGPDGHTGVGQQDRPRLDARRRDDVGVAGYKVFRGGDPGRRRRPGRPTRTPVSPTATSLQLHGQGVRRGRQHLGAVEHRDRHDARTSRRRRVPGNLAAQAVSSTQVNVSWNASTDNVGRHRLQGLPRRHAGRHRPRERAIRTPAAAPARPTATPYSRATRPEMSPRRSPAVTATTPAPDTSPPGASITAPAAGTVVSGSVSVSATATDNVGVAGVQFLLDGATLGSEDTTAPYSMTWDTTTAPNGVHTIQARARDTAGNLGTSSSSVTVTVSNTAPPPTPGLVAGWSFNESSGRTASDVSGNGNTATAQGDPSWASGRYGGGLRFDGTNDYLTAPNSPSLNISGNAMTLSMWINPLGGAGDQVAFAKFWGGTMTSPYYQYGMELDGGVTPHFYIGIGERADGRLHGHAARAEPMEPPRDRLQRVAGAVLREREPRLEPADGHDHHRARLAPLHRRRRAPDPVLQWHARRREALQPG